MILSDFERFWTIFEPFRLDLQRPCGSSIAGRTTAANVDNMLSAEPSKCKCWNMLNVDRPSNCCVQHVEHFAKGLTVAMGARAPRAESES